MSESDDGPTVNSSEEAKEMLDAIIRFADRGDGDQLASSVRALRRLFAVRTEAFQDPAMYGSKVTVHLPGEDGELVGHKAIVFEPGVGEAPPGRYWDPNREEPATPEDYPTGTVNVVRAPDGEDMVGDYLDDVVVQTSITPAADPKNPQKYTYTPGW